MAICQKRKKSITNLITLLESEACMRCHSYHLALAVPRIISLPVSSTPPAFSQPPSPFTKDTTAGFPYSACGVRAIVFKTLSQIFSHSVQYHGEADRVGSLSLFYKIGN